MYFIQHSKCYNIYLMYVVMTRSNLHGLSSSLLKVFSSALSKGYLVKGIQVSFSIIRQKYQDWVYLWYSFNDVIH